MILDPDSPQAEAEWRAWCELYERRHEAKKPSKFEAIGIFRAELPELALDKISSNEQPDHFKSILHTLRKWANGDKSELNIERAKAHPLENLFSQYGLQSRSGAVHCPFHDDSSPSLTIDHKTNRWRCWGCNAGGDTIDFVMKKENTSFPEAVTRLSL